MSRIRRFSILVTDFRVGRRDMKLLVSMMMRVLDMLSAHAMLRRLLVIVMVPLLMVTLSITLDPILFYQIALIVQRRMEIYLVMAAQLVYMFVESR